MKLIFKLLVICVLLQAAIAVNTQYGGCLSDVSTDNRILPYPLGTTSDYLDCAEACFIAGFFVSGISQAQCRCSNGYSTNLGSLNISKGTCGNQMTTTPLVTEVYIVEWGYMGCFAENNNNSRIMSHHVDDFVAVNVCVDDCIAAGYPYAGYIAGGGGCYCSNVYNVNYPVTDSLCWDPSQMPNQIAVYVVWTMQSAYVGCFLDSIWNRDLPHSAGLTDPSVTDCVSYCANNGYAYAGLQYHSECWCGNSYGSQGTATDSNCTFACTGTPSGSAPQYCGGACQNSVYSTAGYILASTAMGEANPLPLQKRAQVKEERFANQIYHKCWCGQCDILGLIPDQYSDVMNYTQPNSVACCDPTAMATCNGACLTYCNTKCKNTQNYNNALCATLPNATGAPCYELSCSS